MSHVDPSMSSGSSPGLALAIVPRLLRIPTAAEDVHSEADRQTRQAEVSGGTSGGRALRLSRPTVPFNPLIQPKDLSGKDTLSGVQKYLLRVILGFAGKTVLHRGRLVEVIEIRDSTHRLSPLMKPDLSEGNGPLDAFWVARTSADRKQFNLERRDKSRRHLTIGVGWGEPRPKAARRQRLRSNFPSPDFVRRLVVEMEYSPEAALAAIAWAHKPWAHPKSDRRKAIAPDADEQGVTRSTGHQSLVDPNHPYNPAAPSRRTLRGGGFSPKQVRQGLSRMRADGRVGDALFEIVYRRRSTKKVAEEFDLSPENLYVYASRLRQHIRADLHAAENLS
jgi:hypothetical protein